MLILVLNSGSSSLKYQLINTQLGIVLAKGNFERIGQKNAFLTHKVGEEKHKFELEVENHKEALNIIISKLTSKSCGVISGIDEISAIGHRVVHGGEKFKNSVLVTEEVKKEIEECIPLAPLHNPSALAVLEACMELFPSKPNVAAFDTAFHQTIPEERYIYPIPYEYYEKYKVRKYGFHGTSHYYVANRIAELLGKDVKDLKIVNCHLGQGASICAIQGGKSVETSMGLTPISGIPMCSRAGDLDPSIVTFLMENEGLSPKEMEDVLNKDSGLWGISGVSKDVRDIEKAAEEGNKRAKLALSYYKYIIAQTIAKYAVSMQGIDVITFTAGVGENQVRIRQGICDNLAFMGIKLENEKNQARGEEVCISSDDSSIPVWIVPTNEELVIARDTKRLAFGN